MEAAGEPRTSFRFADLPPDALRSVFSAVLSDGTPTAEQQHAVPLRDVIKRWFALRRTCRAWAAAMLEEGLPLPPLEVWAASPACLAWLARVGVCGAVFRRRAPPHLDEPSSASDSDSNARPEGAPAGGRFRPSPRRADWRRRRSAGVPSVAEWPGSAYDEMLWNLEGVELLSPAAGDPQQHGGLWSLGSWRRLEALTLQAPGGGRPAAFRAPPSLAGLLQLHRLELSGFGEYELQALPPSLRVLHLKQCQASPEPGPWPVQLADLLGDAAELDLLRFELLPAPLRQLQRQHWEQQAIDPGLPHLRCRCRRLVVHAPGHITLRCACPSCAAAADSESMAQASEVPPNGTPDWQPPPDDPTAWLAEALGWQAAQLVAPGSLLRCVELRTQLPHLEPDGDPADAAGLQFYRCSDCPGVCEYRGALSSQQLREAADAATASIGQGAQAQHERTTIIWEVEQTAGHWVGGVRRIPSGLVMRRLPPGEPLPLCLEEER